MNERSGNDALTVLNDRASVSESYNQTSELNAAVCALTSGKTWRIIIHFRQNKPMKPLTESNIQNKETTAIRQVQIARSPKICWKLCKLKIVQKLPDCNRLHTRSHTDLKYLEPSPQGIDFARTGTAPSTHVLYTTCWFISFLSNEIHPPYQNICRC
jgi:hypothetical protein